MKKTVVLTGIILVATVALAASGQKLPAGQPFDVLQALINAIAGRVTNLETAVTTLQSSAVTRTVFAGSTDLNGPGDVIRDEIWIDNVRRVRHFARFVIPDLTADHPPMISLFHRRRTDSSAPFATTTGFLLSNPQGFPQSTLGGFSVFLDPTVMVVEDGQILIQFRGEIYNPSTLTTPNIVRYGLDGPGGTGEYRLVVIR